MKIKLEREDFTDLGDGRVVVHFLSFVDLRSIKSVYGYDAFEAIIYGYDLAVRMCEPLGGQKFHNNTYGGGIMFQGELDEIRDMINDYFEGRK